ncbi:PDZ and LIM domain protein 7-like isoform X2 [Protopterus annectens]|uniref:PDZ and LIM domain protein 7-like isoform X2 n=1 Tax=Protopterus annectens TaxID=7888 RepID=UPI001CF93ED5|nr:PDZ and LIM domain protein 7-like isoform X2 [Protopterus annectens]
MSNIEMYKVTLESPAPWGFRLQGGKDFNMPLSMSRLSPGGKAVQAKIGVGDLVLTIDGESTEEMTHIEAQNKIRACSGNLQLTLGRLLRPSGTSQQDSQDYYTQKYSFSPNTALNKTARPFSSGSFKENSQVGPVTRPVKYIPPTTAFAVDTNVRKQQSSQDLKSSASPTNLQDGGQGSKVSRSQSMGPSSRPPWATDSEFAERYAPNKTTTVMTKHSQPAQLTPMENRSSIMQAAQQIPDLGNRTPVCNQCNKIIRGRYLVALGRYYHPEEFTCCQCKKVLDEGGFFEEKGSIYCTKCYDNRYAPNCAKCKKKITSEIMHALKMTWHVQCFVCAACKTPIRNWAFYMEEGQPYCERDYEKMFGTKCHGCDFKIDAGDRFLEALDYSWHDTCFVCAVCHINLEGKTFYSRKDKPLCKTHAFSHV